MRRSVTRKQAVNVSLFPFLAVLICTMGALIVLLIMVVQQARATAHTVTEADEVQEVAPSEEELLEEDFEWQQEVLEGLREQKTEKIAKARLALSHLEEHLRDLKTTWKNLQARAEELRNVEQDRDLESQDNEQQLAELRQAIAQIQNEIAAAQKELAKQPKSFAIVPYEGPNGTRRRPLFIECTRQGVILQPEGLVLQAEDFNGMLGPGNPLDAALRAKREYYARVVGAQQVGEPYPLIIVRPDGVLAYVAARAAMKAWDDEFGYELIEQDVELSYPPVDPNLGQELVAVVRQARRRQATLAAAMPSRYRGGASQGFTDVSGGGGAGAESTGGATLGTGQGGYAATRDGTGQAGGPGNAGRLASTRRNGTQETGAAGRETGGQSQGQPGGSPQAGGGSPQAAGGGQAGQTADLSPIATARGKNFAVPKSKRGMTGVTRYLRVAVLTDRLVILPESGEDRAPRVILLENQMQPQIDRFLAEMWKHVETWDIALPGGYWKPILSVEVAPGSEQRFQELATLLQDSGIRVERKRR